MLVFVQFLVLSKIDEIRHQYLRCMIARACICMYCFQYSPLFYSLYFYLSFQTQICIISGKPVTKWDSSLMPSSVTYRLTSRVLTLKGFYTGLHYFIKRSSTLDEFDHNPRLPHWVDLFCKEKFNSLWVSSQSMASTLGYFVL